MRLTRLETRLSAFDQVVIRDSDRVHEPVDATGQERGSGVQYLHSDSPEIGVVLFQFGQS